MLLRARHRRVGRREHLLRAEDRVEALLDVEIEIELRGLRILVGRARDRLERIRLRFEPAEVVELLVRGEPDDRRCLRAPRHRGVGRRAADARDVEDAERRVRRRRVVVGAGEDLRGARDAHAVGRARKLGLRARDLDPRTGRGERWLMRARVRDRIAQADGCGRVRVRRADPEERCRDGEGDDGRPENVHERRRLKHAPCRRDEGARTVGIDGRGVGDREFLPIDPENFPVARSRVRAVEQRCGRARNLREADATGMRSDPST